LPFFGGGGGGACEPVTIFFGGTGAVPTFFGGAEIGTCNQFSIPKKKKAMLEKFAPF